MSELNHKANEQETSSPLAKAWLVIEVKERDLISVTLCNTEKAAVDKANELLEEHICSVGYEDRLSEVKEDMEDNPDADVNNGEFQFARVGCTTAWCNLRYNWDVFIIEIQTPESIKTVLDRLMEENKANLEDPSDAYAKGYHDALVDILKELRYSTDEKYFD